MGPKAACSILTALDPNRLAAAIHKGDARAISSAKGVGIKIAQKIILELSGKLAGAGVSAAYTHGGGAADGDAMDALLVLGYRREEAAEALRGLDPALSLEQKIAEALKRLSVI